MQAEKIPGESPEEAEGKFTGTGRKMGVTGLPKPPKPGTYREPESVKFSKTSNRNLTRNPELPSLLPGFYQEFLDQTITNHLYNH